MRSRPEGVPHSSRGRCLEAVSKEQLARPRTAFRSRNRPRMDSRWSAPCAICPPFRSPTGSRRRRTHLASSSPTGDSTLGDLLAPGFGRLSLGRGRSPVGARNLAADGRSRSGTARRTLLPERIATPRCRPQRTAETPQPGREGPPGTRDSGRARRSRRGVDQDLRPQSAAAGRATARKAQGDRHVDRGCPPPRHRHRGSQGRHRDGAPGRRPGDTATKGRTAVAEDGASGPETTGSRGRDHGRS